MLPPTCRSGSSNVAVLTVVFPLLMTHLPHQQAPHHARHVLQHLRELLKVIIEFTLRQPSQAQSAELQSTIYRLLSRLAQANDTMRIASKWGDKSGLINRLLHSHTVMVSAFEHIRIVREYRTPRSIQSFCKIVVFMLPSLLAPAFTYMAKKGTMEVIMFNERQPFLFAGATGTDGSSGAYSRAASEMADAQVRQPCRWIERISVALL